MNNAELELQAANIPVDWYEECKEFLASLVELESEPDLPIRRRNAVEYVCKYFQAEFGFWSWGHGHPENDGRVVPIALIPWGLAPQRIDAFFQLGMTKDSDRWLRTPFLPLLMEQMQVCRARHQLWTDEEWHASEFRNALTHAVQLDEWMTCVRYPSKHMWSCVSLLKPVGAPRFRNLDVMLLDLACTGISWLQSGVSGSTKEQSVAGLGQRNAEVLYLLLDGRSRKEIAAALGLTMHVVNDCIKQIYHHFGATSATELAALFLRRV